jgi:hypothetical protein
MDTLRLLATLLPVSLTSGINLYLTILVAGISMRAGWVDPAHPTLEVLASWPVLGVAGFFYLLQFFADKVQFIDNVWDFIHTFIRPVGAVMLGITVLGQADPVFVLIAAMISGGIALVSHGAKSGGRATLNSLSPAENVSNIALSLSEDAVVGGLTFLALKYPYWATGIALVILLAIIVIVPQFMRWGWITFSSLFLKLKAFLWKVLNLLTAHDVLPVEHRVLLNHRTPEIVAKCQAHTLPGAGGRSGFLSVLDNEVYFTYHTWFSSRVWKVKIENIKAAYLRNRPLVDLLEIYYKDKSDKEKAARFAFLKDRTPLAEKIFSQVTQVESVGIQT